MVRQGGFPPLGSRLDSILKVHIITGRRDKFNLLNLLGFDLSSFAERRNEQRL